VAPIPTATSIAPPPLTASFLPRVAPGKRQVIVIASAPSTVVHIMVVFPDGEQVTGVATTDASGSARYSFVQPSSTVTFGHVFAYLELSTGPGPAGATFTNHYRIGWGRIDVSVIPRKQKVGKFVRVWVHTRARHKVVIVLRFPRGAPVTLHGRTDRTGWVEVPFRVPRYRRTPNNATVVVHGKVRLPKGVFVARATFAIGA
jgi:hypothetical protein